MCCNQLQFSFVELLKVSSGRPSGSSFFLNVLLGQDVGGGVKARRAAAEKCRAYAAARPSYRPPSGGSQSVPPEKSLVSPMALIYGAWPVPQSSARNRNLTPNRNGYYAYPLDSERHHIWCGAVARLDALEISN